MHSCCPAPLKLFANLRLPDERLSCSFLKVISKEGFANTKRALINTRVPLDAKDHAPNEKPHPLAQQSRSKQSRACSPLSLGLTERMPHVTTLSWHLCPGGTDFLRIPSRGGWGKRERPCLYCPQESLHCALQAQRVAWDQEREGVRAPSRTSCCAPGPWP